MVKERDLTPEEFELLLSWLDPEREKAGEKYESIRHRLVVFFSGRGCLEADDLTDETMTRVTIKLPHLINSYQGDPTYYFYGVARKVYQEHLRRFSRPIKPPPPPVGWSELVYQCLEECMAKLPPHSRRMFEKYHCGETSDNTVSRQGLAEQLGIGLNALRIRVYRVRGLLKACVEDCLAREGE